MRNSFSNPWVNMMFEQMWIVRQAVSPVAKRIEPAKLRGLLTLTDRSLNPREPRLNPLEFHGKRRNAPGRTCS